MENGGYFVSRIKKNMNPVIVSIEEGALKSRVFLIFSGSSPI
jgi:hypothetical protein